MKIIDLTHPIIHGMQVFPGDIPPHLRQTHFIGQDGFTDHQLTISMHTGTHIDGMWHMVDNKCFIGDIPIESLIGQACIIDIRKNKLFSDIQLVKEKSNDCSMILFYTGFGQHFGTEKYLTDYPVIDNAVAELITTLKIKMVGVDSLSPDYTPHQLHKTLLSHGILIAENLMNLHLLLNLPRFTIVALPLKINADSAPARIIALVE
jgi:kynurenine formamidase